MTNQTWWIGLAQSEFYRQALTESERMRHDPKAKFVSTHPHQFSEVRKPRPTPYRYHIEQEQMEALL